MLQHSAVNVDLETPVSCDRRASAVLFTIFMYIDWCCCRTRHVAIPPFYFWQTQGVFNVAKKLTEKMRKKGKVTENPRDALAAGGGGDSGGESDYEIREDGVELTGNSVLRRKTGTWATVEDSQGDEGEPNGKAAGETLP